MKKLEPKEGPITKALNEAIALRRQLIDDGTLEVQADQIIGQGLKAVLGNSRPTTWRFYCDQCRDTGWINVEPSVEEHARLLRMYGSVSADRGYVVSCEPCRWRQLEREKRRQKFGEDDANDLVAAGKTRRHGDFTRLSR